MNMPHPLARAILERRKTEHRLPDRYKLRWHAGRTYPLVSLPSDDPPLKRREWGLFTVRWVRRQPLDAMTDQDAKNEGHKSLDAFREYWLNHFGPFHGQAWVIALELETDPAALLHRNSEKGYTTDPSLALRGEPESPDATALARYAVLNRERQGKRAGARAETRSITGQIKTLMFEAERNGVDMTFFLAGLRRHLEAATHVVRGKDAA